MEKTIWNMELHEVLELNNDKSTASINETVLVMRVAGGWIYTKLYNNTLNSQRVETSVFVPYSPKL
ncbi:hypothetical protein [Flavobacterium johnsoniae]|uniref:Uncharacterized protein n=1 Tax=Flavobacterium johnsoniae TaxID=986 RepID=A0A1M5VJT2_FLAJO|nr:hypothetical protein [Flavobacterium johnsoniae]SHH75467.1 hypothetical protein SAMN05444388_11819 [Flavobacterium johnsoniae]